MLCAGMELRWNEVATLKLTDIIGDRMMRYSSIEITLESYVRADPRKLKTATNSVNDALFG